MTESAMLALAGAVILLCLGIIGWFIRTGFEGIKDGFTELKEMFNTLTARFDRLAEKQSDCVTWDDLAREIDPLKEKIESHGHSIVALQTTCKAVHGGK